MNVYFGAYFGGCYREEQWKMKVGCWLFSVLRLFFSIGLTCDALVLPTVLTELRLHTINSSASEHGESVLTWTVKVLTEKVKGHIVQYSTKFPNGDSTWKLKQTAQESSFLTCTQHHSREVHACIYTRTHANPSTLYSIYPESNTSSLPVWDFFFTSSFVLGCL